MIENITDLHHTFEKNMLQQTWWPAESPWEIAVGAILVQNTNWQNVDKTLDNFRQTIGFDPQKIAALSLEKLQDMIRPSGFFKNKSLAIQALFRWFKSYQFDLQEIAKLPTEQLRKKLLAIRGIGSETADVLLVFIFGKAVFIADRYAQRLFTKLGIHEKLTYPKLQRMILLPDNFSNTQAKNLHGWIIEYGKIYLKNEAAWQVGFLANFKLKIS